eukprot:8117402-Lingulodinium_polyedra.AAC.1
MTVLAHKLKQVVEDIEVAGKRWKNSDTEAPFVMNGVYQKVLDYNKEVTTFTPDDAPIRKIRHLCGME